MLRYGISQRARTNFPSSQPFSAHSNHRLRSLVFVFISSIVLLVLVACVSIKFWIYGSSLSDSGSLGNRQLSRRASNIEAGHECRLIQNSSNQCLFLRANCSEEDSGLISYLSLYYCTLSNVKPVALIIMVIWGGLLFSTIGIAASDFFCINLSTISTLLGLSETLAGVTFLAFGNGSPDVFSTFAAMRTHSGSLAVGELIGAASFITAIVSGSMAIVRPFKVARETFLRDIFFFIVAASFSLGFLADGRLALWECVSMVAFYAIYVITVVIWHWVVGRKKHRRQREALARTEFLARGDNDTEENDNAEENDTGSQQEEELGVLNSSSNLHISDRFGLETYPNFIQDLEETSSGQLIAEVNQGMRLNRPNSSIRRNTGNTIRPSLVGALEFRSVLSSLERQRAQKAFPKPVRRYSDDPTHALTQVSQQTFPNQSGSDTDPHLTSSDSREFKKLWRSSQTGSHGGLSRDRAVSMNDAPNLQSLGTSSSARAMQVDSDLYTPSISYTLDQNSLHPNYIPIPTSSYGSPNSDIGLSRDSARRATQTTILSRNSSRARAAEASPSRGSAESIAMGDTSTVDKPFSPQALGDQKYSESTALPAETVRATPTSPFAPYHDDFDNVPSMSQRNGFPFTQPDAGADALSSGLDPVQSTIKPVHWWPHRILPSPEILFSTLFPTLFNWNQKNLFGKLLSILSAPSILLLTLSLPVVEMDGDETPTKARPALSQSTAMPASCHSDSRTSPNHPPLIILNSHDGQTEGQHHVAQMAPAEYPEISDLMEHVQSPQCDQSDLETPNIGKGWNRWLVSTQVFVAPLFLVAIIWASESEAKSPRQLLIAIACSLIGSLIIFGGIVLKTTPSNPPRYRSLMCFLGFLSSVAWISTIANEVVGLLKAFGIILGISDAILGLTIFAVGNSLGDLVADITIAKLGFPVMALSACFGGPMLNILLGIGISGIYVTITENREHSERHLSQASGYRPYELEIGRSLLISGATLLITLVSLLVAVPINNWVMDKKIGWALVTIWSVSTAINVVMEISAAGWNYL